MPHAAATGVGVDGQSRLYVVGDWRRPETRWADVSLLHFESTETPVWQATFAREAGLESHHPGLTIDARDRVFVYGAQAPVDWSRTHPAEHVPSGRHTAFVRRHDSSQNEAAWHRRLEDPTLAGFWPIGLAISTRDELWLAGSVPIAPDPSWTQLMVLVLDLEGHEIRRWSYRGPDDRGLEPTGFALDDRARIHVGARAHRRQRAAVIWRARFDASGHMDFNDEFLVDRAHKTGFAGAPDGASHQWVVHLVSGRTQLALHRFGPNGKRQWTAQPRVPQGTIRRVASVLSSCDGSSILATSYEPESTRSTRVILHAIDRTGQPTWSEAFSSGHEFDHMYVHALSSTPTGTIVAAGMATTKRGAYEMWVAELDPRGPGS